MNMTSNLVKVGENLSQNQTNEKKTLVLVLEQVLRHLQKKMKLVKYLMYSLKQEDHKFKTSLVNLLSSCLK
jgi:hypothetical protein